MPRAVQTPHQAEIAVIPHFPLQIPALMVTTTAPAPLDLSVVQSILGAGSTPVLPTTGPEEPAVALWSDEEAVDWELEQLYLSHLSQLQAEALGGPLGPLDQMGPEQALNSALVEEMARHAADNDEDARHSPPALLEGACRPMGPALAVPARTPGSLAAGGRGLGLGAALAHLWPWGSWLEGVWPAVAPPQPPPWPSACFWPGGPKPHPCGYKTCLCGLKAPKWT